MHEIQIVPIRFDFGSPTGHPLSLGTLVFETSDGRRYQLLLTRDNAETVWAGVETLLASRGWNPRK